MSGTPIDVTPTGDKLPRAEGTQVIDLAPTRIETRSLPKGEPETPRVATGIRSTVIAGGTVILVTFFGFGVWAATAPLSGAVMASATLASEGQRRSVQHLEGGIIRQLLVREGDVVNEGDTLVRLDPLAPLAQVNRLGNQLDTQRALTARLMAERGSRDEIAFPEDLLERSGTDVELDAILNGQREQFIERRISVESQIAILRQQIVQLRSQIQGRNEQEVAHRDQIEIIDEELSSLLPLLESGIVSRPRILQLQREAARLRGLLAENGAQRAVAEQSIGEAELQITQTRQTRLDEVIEQLREAESRIADLSEQHQVALDVLDRLEIVAPQSGVVQNLQVSTVSGVIAPGQVLMEIAPVGDDLLIQSRVSPNDVANVSVGQDAEVRFVGLDLRRTPEILGTVITLSGDSLIDEVTGAPYFLAQVRTSPEEMEKLHGQTVHAGMPAEVFIQTGERTFLQYLTKPLTDAIARGLNER